MLVSIFWPALNRLSFQGFRLSRAWGNSIWRLISLNTVKKELLLFFRITLPIYKKKMQI